MTRDTLDDEPVRDVAENFEGMDCAADPTLLAPGMLSDGMNVYCRGDGKVQSRPGLKRNSDVVNTAFDGTTYVRSPEIFGVGFYDIPGFEATLVAIDDKIVSVPNAGDNVSAANNVAGFGVSSITAKVHFHQLVDRMFALKSGILFHCIYSGGAWTTNTVNQFSDASAMPTWSRVCTHKFRLFALEVDGTKLYASAVGQAHNAADWVKTDNFRVGAGEGDPGRALISNQAGFLTMLCARSVWQIDTSAAAVADWTSLRVTGLTGCVEGNTAVQINQDIVFLAREGVVSLGALADSTSISPAATLSAPIQPWIDRINWSAIATAFACKWSEYYLLALPIDSNTRPKHIFAFNVRTRRWMPPWIYNLGNHTDPDGNTNTHAGFKHACEVNYGDKAETLIADDVGRLFRFDASTAHDYYAGAGGYNYVSASAVSRHMLHGAVAALKQPLQAEVEFKDCTLTDVDLILLRDGATPTTVDGVFNTNADQLGAASFACTTGIWRKRLSARNKARYRQAAVQVWSPLGPLTVSRMALDAFVDAPEIAA